MNKAVFATILQNWERFIPFSLSERWAGIQAQIVDGVFSAEIVNR